MAGSALIVVEMSTQVAASKLGLSITTLKKICRENSLDRWPFRKRKSLDKVIRRTEQALIKCTSRNPSPEQGALDLLKQQRQHMSVSSQIEMK